MEGYFYLKMSEDGRGYLDNPSFKNQLSYGIEPRPGVYVRTLVLGLCLSKNGCKTFLASKFSEPFRRDILQSLFKSVGCMIFHTFYM